MSGINLELDSEQLLLRDTVRDFVAREIAPLAAERDQDAAFPESELRAAAELGLCGLMIDENHGGNPVGTLGAAIVYEEVAKASPAVSVTLSVHNSLVSTAIGRFGSDELMRAYLPKLASGEILGAYALTEPGAGSDAASISTTASAVDGGYRLNGRKVFVTNGGHAGVYVVFAVTDGSARTSKRISAFLVDRDSEGLSVPRKERKLGLRASEIVELTFTDCFVPGDHLLGEPGGGFGIAMSLLDGGRIGIGAQALGIAGGAYQRAVSYAMEREQFGQPIANFQATQWKLADMTTRIEATRLLVWHSAWLRDAGEPHSLEASQAKLFASETAAFVTEQALQVHGGYGYLEDYAVERYFRDARATVLYEGTSEIQRLVISRHVLSQS